MSTSSKKFHFTYKTTNLITSKFYLGLHSTNKINDGYLGSGLRLTGSIKKYGQANHKIEILKYFNSRQELILGEIDLITEEVLKDPMCLNLSVGGMGTTETHSKETNSKISNSKKGKLLSDEHKKKISNGLRNQTERSLNSRKEGVQNFLKNKLSKDGFIVSEEVKLKISKTLSGQPLTEERKKNISEKTKLAMNNPEVKAKLLYESTCPHCLKTGKGSGMFRWHFNNCKNKTT